MYDAYFFHALTFKSRRIAQWVFASAPTEALQCWSNPTIPRQPDTTGSLPSHVNFMKKFHSFEETLGRVERGGVLLHFLVALSSHYRMTFGHKQTDS